VPEGIEYLDQATIGAAISNPCHARSACITTSDSDSFSTSSISVS
jgi:hypothetical protein